MPTRAMDAASTPIPFVTNGRNPGVQTLAQRVWRRAATMPLVRALCRADHLLCVAHGRLLRRAVLGLARCSQPFFDATAVLGKAKWTALLDGQGGRCVRDAC